MDRRTFIAASACSAAGMALATAATAFANDAASASSSASGSASSSTSGSASGSASGSESAAYTPSFLEAPAAPDSASVADEVDCDVLVIGTGTSGNPAVLAAAEAGCKVIGIDKGADVGFVPSSKDFGVYGSKYQQQIGIDLPAKNEVVSELMKDMCYRSNPALLNYWYDHSGETFDWLIDGDEFQVLESSDGEPQQDCYIQPKLWPNIDGYDWHEEYFPFFNGTLRTFPDAEWVMRGAASKAEALGATFIYNMRADQLIKDDAGRVVGAYAYDADGNCTKFNASKGVVLACGDMSGDQEMINYYAPQVSGFAPFYTRVDADGNKTNTGDGIKMAQWAGASMELGPYAPMTHHRGGALGIDAFLQLNANGERFMNEDVPGQSIQDQLSRQPGGFSWQILDDKWRDELSAQAMGHGNVNYYLSADEAAAKPWLMQSSFMGYITEDAFLNGNKPSYNPGITCQADTLEELAQKMELPADVVTAQVQRYNDLANAGNDDDFGKPAKRMFALDTPPYYACKFEQCGMLVCMGGIKCDIDMHALDADDNAIPGLYVCGNTMGGRFLVEYPVVVAGISLGSAITFGKLAGSNCAAGI